MSPVIQNGRLQRTCTSFMHGLKLTPALDKTLTGRIQKGFDFLGYWFSSIGLCALAQKTTDIKRLRLHELNTPDQRVQVVIASTSTGNHQMNTRTKLPTLLALTGLLSIVATSAQAQAFKSECRDTNVSSCQTAFIKKRPTANKFTVKFDAALWCRCEGGVRDWGVPYEGNVFNKSGQAVIATVKGVMDGYQYSSQRYWNSQTEIRAKVWTREKGSYPNEIRIYAAIEN